MFHKYTVQMDGVVFRPGTGTGTCSVVCVDTRTEISNVRVRRECHGTFYLAVLMRAQSSIG